MESIPDVQEERFTQTLNEGGPEAIEQPQGGEIYAGEEEEIVARPSLAPREPIVPPEKLTPAMISAIDDFFGIGRPPKERSVEPLREYLTRINQAIGSNYPTNVSREELRKNINAGLIEAYRETLKE
jgi:hypothetical protein